jgi:hypothetical protein
MRIVAGLLDIALGLVLAVSSTTLVTLDFPANAVVYVVAGLLVVAGIGVLTRASWGATLGQWLSAVGVAGVALLVGAAVTLVTVPDWGGLMSAVMIVLGIPVLLASSLAFVSNRRARQAAGS